MRNRDVPEPARRYLTFALAPEQRSIRCARIEHTGEMALRPDRWKSFRSKQIITTETPSFVWDARIRFAPCPLHVSVRDSYVDGVGSSRAPIAGLVRLGGQQGTAEIAASALWLASVAMANHSVFI